MDGAMSPPSPPAPSENVARLAMKQLWRSLSPGPWRTENEQNLTTDEMLRAIIEAASMYEGDFAGASHRRHLLVTVGALSGVRHEDGSITWTKADTFPQPPEDGLSWVDRENAKLRKEHERNLAEMEREGQLAVEHAEFLDAPEQAQFVMRLHKAGVTPDHIRAIVRAEVEAALETLTQHLAAQHENGQRPEEVGIHE